MRKSFAVLGIALGLSACTFGSSETRPAQSEPEEPSGDVARAGAPTPGPAAAPASTVVRAQCGSIEVSSAIASNDRSKATAVAAGQLAGARIDPKSQTNREHYWSAKLRAGAYHLVLDSKTATGKTNNIGLNVHRLDARGNEQSLLVRGNEIARRYRDYGSFEVPSDGVVQFKVQGVFHMEDYVLGIFPNEAPVPSPYFTDCPTITPLSLDKSEAFELGPKDATNDEQWFSLELDSGDFSFLVGGTQASGVNTNLIYGVDLLDRFGEEQGAQRILRTNEIDTSFQAESTHAVGEKSSLWLRVRNDHDALKMNVTVSKQ